MLPALRLHRLAALLVALSLGLGGAARGAAACDMVSPAADRGAAPAPGEAPCPMHPAPGDAPDEAPPLPGATCCAAPAATAPAGGRSLEGPPAPAAASLPVALDLPGPVEAPREVAPTAHGPPVPPLRLHLLHGCFLT